MSPAGVQAASAGAAAPEPTAVYTDRQPETAPDARSRRLLRAVEHYRAACAARGVPVDEEDGWLVLLAALDLEGRSR